MSPPRVRFAPAPTGYLHVGSARTALFNWLFARRHGGEMVLRVEDTDASLKTHAYVDAIVEPLRWLGLDWDSGPYFQSERRGLHSAAIEQMVADGAAYFCDLTRAEIEQRCAAAGLPAGYHGWSRDSGVADGPGVVARFRCPDDGTTIVDDVVRGRVSFGNESLEDFVIRRGDGSPTFHLANAVDDHDMEITHVIRGEDLLNTTPRVQLIWQALGFGAPPAYAHLPLLVNAKRQKLAKRRDDVALDDYRRRGYLPEAMVNYLSLLGWGPPDGVEIRPLDEIVALFDLDAVKPAPAFFDSARLDHINSAYIKALTPEQFADRAEPFLTSPDVPWPPERYDRDKVRVLAGEIQQRIARLGDVAGWIDWILCPEVGYDERAWNKAMVKGRAAAQVLEAVEARLAEDDFTSAERLESIVMGVGDELTERLGARVRSQPPVRVALTGTVAGLPLWEPMRLLGRDATLARLRTARNSECPPRKPQHLNTDDEANVRIGTAQPPATPQQMMPEARAMMGCTVDGPYDAPDRCIDDDEADLDAVFGSESRPNPMHGAFDTAAVDLAAGAAADADQRLCGRNVKRTGLPCLLVVGHRGRCRSILPR